MRRRRPARAAALCLAIAAVLLQLALAVHSAGAAGRPWSRRSDLHRALLPTTTATMPMPLPLRAHQHAVPRARGRGATAFDAAANNARCKSSSRAIHESTAGVRGAACAGVDDDKRVVPTGPNPLHNR